MQRFNMVLVIIEMYLILGVVVCIAGYYNLGWSKWPFGIVASMTVLIDACRGTSPIKRKPR